MSAKKPALLIVLFLAATTGAIVWWWGSDRRRAAGELKLEGNVDLRQVELPFNGSERIAAVLVEEGDRVHRGQVLARLDTSRLEPQVAEAEAQAAAARQIVERLHAGSRPEEIATARANLESARTDAANAQRLRERRERAAKTMAPGVVSEEDLQNARAVGDMAEARVLVAQKTLELALAGPRKEDVAEGEARLAAAEAQAALLRRMRADAELVAPQDGVVRSRILEPGEMASPQRPVFSIAITDPKWVRTYVSEPDLGRVRPGMAATVSVDSFPDRRFEGWIGFISPVAEFTPKPVQTEELRTSLVYEVRVFVRDPEDELRLGMPATVHIPPAEGAARQAREAAPASASMAAPAEGGR
jgi:HlyD family secretion protein